MNREWNNQWNMLASNRTTEILRKKTVYFSVRFAACSHTLRTEYFKRRSIHCFWVAANRALCRRTKDKSVYTQKQLNNSAEFLFDPHSHRIFAIGILFMISSFTIAHTHARWIIRKYHFYARQMQLMHLLDYSRGKTTQQKKGSVYECRYVLDVIKLLPFQTAWNGTKRIFIRFMCFNVSTFCLDLNSKICNVSLPVRSLLLAISMKSTLLNQVSFLLN